MITKFYQIKDKNTGLFSTGGMSPRWTKKGKIWKGTGPLRAHLNQFIHTDYRSPMYPYPKINKIPDNWEIVEIEIQETITNTINAKEFYNK